MSRTFGSIPANETGWPDTSSASGIDESGNMPLVNGQAFISVVFATPKADATWIFVDQSVVNTVDGSPLNIRAGITTAKTATGFTLQLSAAPNSSNYYLSWAVGLTEAGPVIIANSRITDTGDFRVTTSGDRRIYA